MTTINLKDFYSWCTQDEYIEVSDEVAEELRASKQYEAAYRQRVRYHKAYYSLDCDDGIEYSACVHEPSPQELLERKERFSTSGTPLIPCRRFWAAGWMHTSFSARPTTKI